MTSTERDESTPDWLADYDEALLRGEVVPETETDPDPDAESGTDGTDQSREREGLRELLHLLDRTLRTPTIGADAVGTTRGEGTGDVRDDFEEPGAGAGGGYPPLGRFLIERELGRGGYGVVYLAFDPEMERRVALKLPRVDALYGPEIRRRFLHEARAAARLDHPNLVSVYEAGQIGPVCYIASAYCAGPSLAGWLAAADEAIEPRRAARLVRTMADGVAHIHARGLLHCDLKPGNILVDPPARPEGDPVPRITDFGLARLLEAPTDRTASGRPLGTPPYMAPEQIEHRLEAIGPATDVYALGVILYEMLTGKPPHDAETPRRAMRAAVAEPPSRLGLRSTPRDLEAICLRCLAKRPESRYATAADLADDLGRYLTGRPTAARPLGPLRRMGRWCRRQPTAAALLGLGILTMGLSLVAALTLARFNRRLERANVQVEKTLEGERRQRYVATLALAQQDARNGRIGLAQRRLRQWAPGSGEPDRRDFAWFHLYRSTRHERTVLADLMPGNNCRLSQGGNLLLGVTPKLGFWEIGSTGSTDASALPNFRFRPGPPTLGSWGSGELSPDGRRAVLSRRLQGEIGLTVLDPRTGATLADVPWDEVILGDRVRFSGDGRVIAVGLDASADENDQVVRRTISLASGDQLAAFGLRGIKAIASGFDVPKVTVLRYAGSGKSQWSLEAWDLAARARLWAPRNEVVGPAVAVSPLPGGPIATATLEGTVQLRDPDDGTILAKLDGHRSLVRALTFSADGRLLASGADRQAILWDLATRRSIAILEGLRGRVESIAFLPGLTNIALGIGQGEVVIWHTRPTGEVAIPGAHRDEVWGLAYSPNGRVLATAGGDRLVKFWDAESGQLLRSLPGHEEWPARLVFAPDGKTFASADFGGNVLIWETAGKRPLRRFRAHESRIRGLAYSPGGKLLATGSRDQTIRLWDARTWEPVGEPLEHGGDVRDLAFLPDGRSLVSAGHDATVVLWDLSTHRILSRWRFSDTSSATCVAVSPDGETIAAGDLHGGLTFWSVKTQRRLAVLPSLHSEEISDLEFSTDGRILAVAGQDGVLSLVDVATRQPHLTLTGHTGGINRVAFAPNGRTLASASHDHSIRLWQAGPGTPLVRRP